jgi:hypothetical protein
MKKTLVAADCCNCRTVSFEIAGKNFKGRERTLENGGQEAWEGEVAL